MIHRVLSLIPSPVVPGEAKNIRKTTTAIEEICLKRLSNDFAVKGTSNKNLSRCAVQKKKLDSLRTCLRLGSTGGISGIS